MSDIGADVLAEWRVVPEDVASLSVFAFCSRGGFVVEGVLVSAFVPPYQKALDEGGYQYTDNAFIYIYIYIYVCMYVLLKLNKSRSLSVCPFCFGD